MLQNPRDHKVEFQLLSTGDRIMGALLRALGPDKVPATALRAEWIGLPVLPEQREFLEQRGVEVDRLDKAQASVLIGAIRERQKEGLCTYKQAQLLARWGLPVERLDFGEASGLIDSLARLKWKPSPIWVERARMRAEQIARPQP